MKAIAFYVKKLIAFEGPALGRQLAGMVTVSLLGGAGTFLLLPMIGLSGLAATTNVPLLTPLVETLAAFPLAASLAAALCAYAAVMLAQYALQRRVAVRGAKLMNAFGERIRLETYGAVMNAEWTFFLTKKRTELTNSLSAELARVIHGTLLTLQIAASLLFALIQIGVAFWMAPGVTGFVLVCGAALALFSNRYIKRAKELGGRTSRLGQAYLSEVTDGLNGMKEIKSNNLSGYRQDAYRALVRRMAEEQMEYVRMKSDSDFFYKAGSVLFVSGFLYVAATLFHTRLDQLLVVIVVFARLWPVFTGLQASLQQLASSLPAFESIERLQAEAGRASENLKPHAGKLALSRGIECRDVSFRYGGEGEGDALDGIRLFVPANGMTAVVGRSGAGKSTLVDALTGLIRPQRGEVLWDGLPLGAVDVQALRNSIGYVPQDPYLFNGSIRANLTLLKPDATEAELWEALEFASAAAFVGKLPEGLDAEIGDRGVRLSGGERQRLVLARAMLRRPSILVLDEATSALDSENETVIQRALERLKGRATVIVIAHRLSTVRSADQVIVLDEGRIVQSGGYAQLAGEAGGLFRTLLEGGRGETLPQGGGANEKLLTRSL